MGRIETDYSILANTIVDKYVNSISGRSLDEIFVNRDPAQNIMIGKLSSNRVEKTFDGGYVEIKKNQFTSIPSINVSFKVSKKSKGTISVIPHGMLFYSIEPNYEKTVDFLLDELSTNSSYKFKDVNEMADVVQDRQILPSTYKRVEISEYMGNGLTIDLDMIKPGSYSYQEEISEKLSDLEKTIRNEIRIFPRREIFPSDLLTRKDFMKVAKPKDISVNPRWLIDIDINIQEDNDCYKFSLQMVNNTITESTSSNGYLPELFDAGVEVKGNGVEFLSLPMDYYRKGFKYKEPIFAVSENTAVEYNRETNTIKTNNVPKFYQYRMKTKSNLNDKTTFKALLSDPISNLNAILCEMERDLKACELEFDSSTPESDIAKKKWKDALTEYRQEIERFKNGIKQIEYKDFVFKSFNAMNKTFMEKIKGDSREIEGWRLFQIVFIVSLIPEVIRSEYPNDSSIQYTDDVNVNLLYFPTGGGKTEAFFGIGVFTMFFDRFRGKKYGVSAFLKYPLRLLAVQQLDRVLKIVIKANLIKNKIPEICQTRMFEVGFFVGSANTPNKIEKSASDGYGSSSDKHSDIIDLDESILDERYRFIDTCPICGKSSIHVRFNKDRWKLEHFCNNPDCSVHVLPLLIVDSEIYRYLPSIVVCTIDKMAMIGITQDFKALMGQVKTKCPKHGFSIREKCTCSSCKEKTESVGLLKDPIPTIIIQDELHLVKESLGTFDAHYESFIDYYAKELVHPKQKKQIRYIGATATISMYQNHIQELYHMNGKRFPCEYPSKSRDHDFYSFIDSKDISRIILGFAPYGQSMIEGTWLSVYYLRLVVHQIMSNVEEEYNFLKSKGFSSSLSELKHMLYNYWIELVYNNRKQDATELENAFQNQGNNHLQAKNIAVFNIKTMTSDEDFQSVRKTLFDIQANHENLDSTNLILATSTISHGVDEDSFNAMFFYGMPNNNAEYIQAYSRVGRKYTGIVVDIIRLMRIRDRSYLKNFIEFHKNKDDLVETVPINRWARNAVYSTLPGLLMAIILQYYTGVADQSSLFFVKNLKKALNDELIKIDDVAQHLINAYGCNSYEKTSEIYKEIIQEQVETILKGIKYGTINNIEKTADAIGLYSHWEKTPMKSLRDTDEVVEVRLRG